MQSERLKAKVVLLTAAMTFLLVVSNHANNFFIGQLKAWHSGSIPPVNCCRTSNDERSMSSIAAPEMPKTLQQSLQLS